MGTTPVPAPTSDAVNVMKQAEVDITSKKFKDPYEFLAQIPGAPDKAKIESWKAQAPNGRLRVFTPDAGKRVFIVRAIGGAELQRLQAQIPQNMDAAKAEQEVQYLVSALCVVWTNNTTGRLTPDELRITSAGLPVTLFGLISWLSDFFDPESFSVLSAEL